MVTSWTVTTAATSVQLGAERRGEATFTVTNSGAVQDRAVLTISPHEDTDRSWFTIEERQRLLPPGASVSYLVKIVVPPDVPAGDYGFHGQVYSADTAPEESSVLSNRVVLTVAGSPSKPRPWWLLAVAALVAAVLVVAGVLIFRGGDDDTDPPSGATPTTAPPLLAPPVLTNPPDGTVFEHFPRDTTLVWSPVTGAEAYMVEVQFCESQDCAASSRPWRLETVTTTSYRFPFVGAQPGRWRVWALSPTGEEGDKSEWRGFRYTR